MLQKIASSDGSHCIEKMPILRRQLKEHSHVICTCGETAAIKGTFRCYVYVWRESWPLQYTKYAKTSSSVMNLLADCREYCRHLVSLFCLISAARSIFRNCVEFKFGFLKFEYYIRDSLSSGTVRRWTFVADIVGLLFLIQDKSSLVRRWIKNNSSTISATNVQRRTVPDDKLSRI